MSPKILLVAALGCFACGSNSSPGGGGTDAGLSDAGGNTDAGNGADAGSAGCTQAPGSSVASRSYVVSAVTLPASSSQFAFDLNRDGSAENQFGTIVQDFASQGTGPQAGVTAAINSGATVLLITQSSSDAAFQSAGCVSSSVQPGLAASSPDFSGNGSFALDTGAPPAVLTGPIAAAVFTGAEAAPTTASTLTVRLALFGNIITLPLADPQITYAIAATGLANGVINGAVQQTDIQIIYTSIAAGLNAQIAADPNSSTSRQELALFDTGGTTQAGCATGCKNPDSTCAAKDGRIDPCEVATNNVVSSLFAPDVQLFPGGAFAPGKGTPDSLSVGFGFSAVKATVH